MLTHVLGESPRSCLTGRRRRADRTVGRCESAVADLGSLGGTHRGGCVQAARSDIE